MVYRYKKKVDQQEVEYSRFYCVLPRAVISYGLGGILPFYDVTISTKERKTGGMFNLPIPKLNAEDNLILLTNYKSACDAVDPSSTIAIIDIPSDFVKQHVSSNITFKDLFSYLKVSTKKLVSVFRGQNELYTPRYLYLPTYHNLIKQFNAKPDAVTNSKVIANLFFDYWDKGTGIKSFMFFHRRRKHTQLANDLLQELGGDKSLTNDEIATSILSAYNKAAAVKDFNPEGSFAKRCNFAIFNLTNGYCETVPEYSVYKQSLTNEPTDPTTQDYPV